MKTNRRQEEKQINEPTEWKPINVDKFVESSGKISKIFISDSERLADTCLENKIEIIYDGKRND